MVPPSVRWRTETREPGGDREGQITDPGVGVFFGRKEAFIANPDCRAKPPCERCGDGKHFRNHVYMLVAIHMIDRDAKALDPSGLGGALTCDLRQGLRCALGTYQPQQAEEATTEKAGAIDQERHFPGRQHGPAAGEAEVDAHAQAAAPRVPLPRQAEDLLHGVSEGLHVRHQAGAGYDSVARGPGDGQVRRLANAQVIGVNDKRFRHVVL